MRTSLFDILLVLVLATASISLFTGCVADTPEQPGGGTAKLIISVGVVNPGKAGSFTRAEYPDGYPYDFEPAATLYESVSTLRVIVVSGAGLIEGNKVMNFEPRIPQATDTYGDLEFSVGAADRKSVFIIANEAATGIDWTEYGIGRNVTLSELRELKLAGQAGAPYIDNEGEAKTFIPMTEEFEANIPALKPGVEELVHRETFFVTRAAVKFAFNIVNDDEESGSEEGVEEGVEEEVEEGEPEQGKASRRAPAAGSSVRITEITVNGLCGQQYIFPNSTEYLPGKYTVTTDNRRIITSYKCPAPADTAAYTFRPANLGWNFDGTEKYSAAYAPQLYFMESPLPKNGFRLSAKMSIDGQEELVTFPEYNFPNLPNLPRNTFVIVNFTLRNRDLSCEVILMPYVGVWLSPIFGLDTKPNQKKQR